MPEIGFELTRRNGPLIISVPHAGTSLPPGLAARLTDAGRTVIDTDWHVDRLYPFAGELDATMLCAQWSRYCADLNRDPGGGALYPGARTSAFVPVETFEGQPLYARGDEPADGEIAERRVTWWDPYHRALRAELERVRATHGYVLLLDAHSIWGRLPLLFDGELPDVNVGTNSGDSCASAVSAAVMSAVANSTYSTVLDGRFKGGYITRTYGTPGAGVHAVQIELNQRTYLAEGSRTEFDTRKAAALSHVLRRVCEAMLGALVAEGTRPVSAPP